MALLKNKPDTTITWAKSNLVEIWATVSIFVGLPVVALLYFDYRAAVLVFVVAGSIIGTLAVRNK